MLYAMPKTGTDPVDLFLPMDGVEAKRINGGFALRDTIMDRKKTSKIEYGWNLRETDAATVVLGRLGSF